jgi:thiol-disulfide isomerase/thioredoxin
MSAKQKVIEYGGMTLFVLIMFSLVFGSCTPTTVENDTLTVDLADIHGKRLSLDEEQYAGKVVLVNIWGTWCPPCREEIPHLIEIQDDYRDQGFEIIGIDFEGQTAQDEDDINRGLQKFAEDNGINYRLSLGGVGTEPNELFPELQNFQGFPTNIYIGRDGRVRHVTFGFMKSDVKKMKSKIEALLAESTP